MSSITVSPDLRKKLAQLKQELGYKSIDQLLNAVLVEFTQARLQSVSELFRKRLAEKGVTIEELVRENERVRREVYEEWFKESQ